MPTSWITWPHRPSLRLKLRHFALSGIGQSKRNLATFAHRWAPSSLWWWGMKLSRHISQLTHQPTAFCKILDDSMWTILIWWHHGVSLKRLALIQRPDQSPKVEDLLNSLTAAAIFSRTFRDFPGIQLIRCINSFKPVELIRLNADGCWTLPWRLIHFGVESISWFIATGNAIDFELNWSEPYLVVNLWEELQFDSLGVIQQIDKLPIKSRLPSIQPQRSFQSHWFNKDLLRNRHVKSRNTSNKSI